MKRTHGEANHKNGKRTKLYICWCHIIERCNNSNTSQYKFYGARGIKVCDEWKRDYSNFRAWALANGYKDTLTIDRIDNNGNYEPSNCRWVTQKVQCNNRRSNRIISYKGEKYTMKEWSEKLGMNYNKFKHRIYRGWSISKAIETP